MKIRDLKRMLIQRGFTLCRQGNHSVWTHPAHPNQRVVLSGADGRQAHPYQVIQVRKGGCPRSAAHDFHHHHRS